MHGMSMEWASSTVERGFSTVNRVQKSTEQLLLMLRIKLPILTSLDPNYEIKLVNKVVDYYLSATRYHNTTSAAPTADTYDFYSMQSSVDLFFANSYSSSQSITAFTRR